MTTWNTGSTGYRFALDLTLVRTVILEETNDQQLFA